MQIKSGQNVKQIRQGDAMLVEADKLPAGLKARADRTLALGESTGHHHTLTDGAIVYGERTAMQFVVVETPDVKIEHLPDPGIEHSTLPVEQRTWFVPVQVEDDGEQERRALD